MDEDARDVIVQRMPADQAARLQAALDAGWRIERDWQKIRARYTDLDLADAVPREILYLDIGVLVGHIELLEAFLHQEGYRGLDHAVEGGEEPG